MGGKGGQTTTTGYWYGLGAHLALCHGPVDAITQIKVGERVAWSGRIEHNASLEINQPALFGGEEREGGVFGEVDVLMGAADQAPNAYLQQHLGQDIPAFRGIVSLVLKRVWVAAMNPYIKPWSIRATRIARAWYPDKAAIGEDANPAHILLDALTNSEWGMGAPMSDLDLPRFVVAADVLHAEAFGLSLLWSREESIEDFLLAILKHIDGMLYVHPRTGLWTLTLVRDEYDSNTAPVFHSGNILRIEAFSRPAWGEITNQVTVVYRDGLSDTDASVTVQDLAAVQLNSAVVATTIHYPGISQAGLANRVAMRELRQLSTPLARCTFIANRQAAELTMGSVLVLSWPPYGITQLPMRVVRLSYGELTNGAVRVDCVEDVFHLPHSVFAAPPPTGWSEPTHPPLPCPYQTLFELPYWWVVNEITGESDHLLQEIDAQEGGLAACGARPSSDAFGYTVLARTPGSAWTEHGNAAFTPTARIETALPLSSAALRVSVSGGIDLDALQPHTLAIVDDEWLLITAIDPTAHTLNVERGLLDTVPVAHLAGSRLWGVEGFACTLDAEYQAGETVCAQLLTRTPRGTLAQEKAPVMQCTLDQRFIRPYCPGNVRINGQHEPTVVAGGITIAWATRNRRTQTATPILQREGPITPEVGQTTTVRLFDAQGRLRRTFVGVTDSSVTWPLAQECSDCGGQVNDRLVVKVASQRDGLNSWQQQHIAFDRTCYGLRYGQFYGGIA